MQKIPMALNKIASAFHQDAFLAGSTIDEILDAEKKQLSAAELSDAKQFLTQVLDPAMSMRDVRTVWQMLPKDIRIDDDVELMHFLGIIRDKL